MSDVPHVYYFKNSLFNKAEDFGLEVFSNTRPDVNSRLEQDLRLPQVCKALARDQLCFTLKSELSAAYYPPAIGFDLDPTLLQTIMSKLPTASLELHRSIPYRLANYSRRPPSEY